MAILSHKEKFDREREECQKAWDLRGRGQTPYGDRVQ